MNRESTKGLKVQSISFVIYLRIHKKKDSSIDQNNFVLFNFECGMIKINFFSVTRERRLMSKNYH
jgi:hypothetical protein